MYGLNDWGNDLLSGTSYIPARSKSDFTISRCDNYYEVKATTMLATTSWTSNKELYVECGNRATFVITDSR
jgi:hypothetical protein